MRNSILKLIATWTGLNLLLGMIGIWIGWFFSEYSLSFGWEDLVFSTKGIVTQSAVFSILLLLTINGRYKRLAIYAFAIIQVLVAHGLFLMNMVKRDGGYFFQTTFDTFTYHYFIYNHAPILSFIEFFKSVQGMFDHGFIFPADTGYVYFLWVLMPSLYFFLLTWVVQQLMNR